MNKGGLLHPRLFDQNAILWDRKVQLQSIVEVFDPVNQSQKTYIPAPGIPEYLDCRIGVFLPSRGLAAEVRTKEMTVASDTEFIAIRGYWPQIEFGWQAQIVGGEAWDIIGIVFDSTLTQTYMEVQRVTE